MGLGYENTSFALIESLYRSSIVTKWQSNDN